MPSRTTKLWSITIIQQKLRKIYLLLKRSVEAREKPPLPHFPSRPPREGTRHTRYLMPLEAPGPCRLTLDPEHRCRARIGWITPIPRRKVVEDKHLRLHFIRKRSSHDRGAMAVLYGVAFDVGVGFSLRVKVHTTRNGDRFAVHFVKRLEPTLTIFITSNSQHRRGSHWSIRDIIRCKKLQETTG